MSVYLYAFETTPKRSVYHLKFRRGNAQDVECDRLAARLDTDFHLPIGTQYVNHATDGALVYVTTAPIHSRLWYDCDDLPGAPIIVGHYSDGKVGGLFEVVELPCERAGGVLRITSGTPWKVTGLGALDYYTAVQQADDLNRHARESHTPVTFDVQPYQPDTEEEDEDEFWRRKLGSDSQVYGE
jgi:hypothetical protein